MHRFIIFVLCLLSSIPLYSEDEVFYVDEAEDLVAKVIETDEFNAQIIDLNGSPSALVHGCVNVITGNYLDFEEDLSFNGPVSLSLERRFKGDCKIDGSLKYGWDHNHGSKITPVIEREKPQYLVLDESGSCMKFTGSFSRKKEKPFYISKDVLKFGVTNASASSLSCKYNLQSKEILFREAKDDCSLLVRGGDRQRYSKKKDEQTYLLQSISKRNGNKVLYSYDKHNQISKVSLVGRQGKTIGCLSFYESSDYSGKDKLSIYSHDGRSATYTFDKMISNSVKKHRKRCLTHVSSPKVSDLKYEYKHNFDLHLERLVLKKYPDDRFLKIQYYEPGINSVGGKVITIDKKKDSRVGRVAAIYAPVGTDKSPVLLYKFQYNLSKDKVSSNPIGGSTDVYDCFGIKTTYKFSSEHRLHCIDSFDRNGLLYKKERMLWGLKGTDNYTFLKARVLEDHKGEIVYFRGYHYDKSGNVKEECLAGNLTGENQVAPELDGKGDLIPNGCEVLRKKYTYDPWNRLIEEDDGRKIIIYEYKDGFDLIKAKYIKVCDEIKERHFFEYDDNGALTLHIIDDGCLKDQNELANVSERHITRIQNSQVVPVGLPVIIIESCFDPVLNYEFQLKKKINTYNKTGQLITEAVYDAADNFAYSREWEYNSKGQLICENDLLGKKTEYEYDDNFNCILKQTEDYVVLFHYDFSNRLIKEVFTSSDGQSYVKTYAYDYRGNKIAVKDINGNEIQYKYDEFGRVVEKIMPPVQNESGQEIYPNDRINYDILNHPLDVIDSNGHVTTTLQTLHHKPCFVRYPDGSTLKHIYCLDGVLKETIEHDGLRTVYEHDYRGRKTREEVYSPDGNLISTKSWIYNAFHLLSEIDQAGQSVKYTYDIAGRLIGIVSGDQITRYEYDSMGRQSAKIEYYNQTSFRKTHVSYDLFDRPVEERVEDELGQVFSINCFEYDSRGNQRKVIKHASSGPVVSETFYDVHNRAIRHIDAAGHVSTVKYYSGFLSEEGYSVSCVEEIDPAGNLTRKIYDTNERLAQMIRFDSQRRLSSYVSNIYDPKGQLIRRIDKVIISGEVSRSVTTAFEYDSMGNEISIIEAYGEAEEKITRREYTFFGEIKRIVKPNGTILNYEYDDLRRVKALFSSEGSVHYSFEYDVLGNLIKAIDQIHNCFTQRTYDQNGRITEEILENGIHLEYCYDYMGRIERIILPDHTEIGYFHNALHLNSVTRLDKTIKYSYDLSGKVSKIDYPNSGFDIQYQSDSNLRLISIFSKYWSQEIPRNGWDPNNNLLEVVQEDHVGRVHSNYTYDTLDQLVSEDGIESVKYQFDSLFNRVSRNDVLCQSNSLNQLVEFGATEYGYDSNGNLSQIYDLNKEIFCEYDALDRLISYSTCLMKVSFSYDFNNRRMGKMCWQKIDDNWHPFKEEKYLYQGEKEIGAVNEEGVIYQLRILGVGCQGDVGASVLLELDGNSYIPVHDHRGNVTTLISVNTLKPIESYRYSAYGEEFLYNQAGLQVFSGINPWRFSSKRVDEESGWLYFGHRYYDPKIGRWTTPDPAWFTPGVNLYSYVKNRPLLFIDPAGLYDIPVGGLLDPFIKRVVGNHFEDIQCFLGCGEEPYSINYVVGQEYNPYVTFTFIQGIDNSLNDSMNSAKLISEMTGNSIVVGTYNATHGKAVDLLECVLGKIGFRTPPSEILLNSWLELLQSADNSKPIVHICHSQGAIHTYHALQKLDRTLIDRIHVIAIAPATIIPPDMCNNASNICSNSDIVQYADLIGLLLNQKCVETIKKNPDAHRMIDHSFDSPTFRGKIQTAIDAAIERNKYYGVCNEVCY